MIPSKKPITKGLPTGWMAFTKAVLKEDITSFILDDSVTMLSFMTIVLLWDETKNSVVLH